MSATGHSRRSDGQQGLRRCPLCLQWRPNLCVATNRRDVPIATYCAAATNDLFDHLVGADERLGRKVYTETGGPLLIYDRLVVRWRVDRQIAPRRAAKN